MILVIDSTIFDDIIENYCGIIACEIDDRIGSRQASSTHGDIERIMESRISIED